MVDNLVSSPEYGIGVIVGFIPAAFGALSEIRLWGGSNLAAKHFSGDDGEKP